ncbi:dihydrodipicolinate synthase family protein [candidate division KSB1 bacterium]
MTRSVQGIFPALVTPFDNNEVAADKLRSNIEKYNPVGFGGYLVLGSTGESVLMSEKDRLTAVEAVKSAAVPEKIIIAGTGLQSAPATIDFSNKAAGAGADLALVVTPFYYKGQMTAGNLEAYFREVADNVKIPVLLYNVQKFTGVSLPLETIATLAEHPNIAGLKESSGNIAFLTEILKACPADFSVLQGSGSVLFSSLQLGAHGGILALSNFAARETVEIFNCVRSGELDRAKELQYKVIGLNQKIVGSFGVPGIKYALDLLGYHGGKPMAPLREAPQNVKDAVRELLSEAGLLS